MDVFTFAAILVACVAIVAMVAITYRPEVARDVLDMLRRLIELLREALSIRRLL